jgi:hypothetical protein
LATSHILGTLDEIILEVNMKTIIVVGAGKSEPKVLDIIKEKITSSNNKYTAPQATPKSCKSSTGCYVSIHNQQPT